MSHELFEAFGIRGAEDRYSDIICYAFNHDNEFKKLFLDLLEDKNFKKSGVKVAISREPRLEAELRKQGKVTSGIPDITISPAGQPNEKLILIENKISSKEGASKKGEDQTVEYEEKGFKHNFYLTLNKTEGPQSLKFIHVTYEDLAGEVLTKMDLSSSNKLHLVLNELNEILKEHYDFYKTLDFDENDKLCTFLKESYEKSENGGRIIPMDTFAGLEKVMSYNEPKIEGTNFTYRDFERSPGQTNAICHLFKKNWVGKPGLPINENTTISKIKEMEKQKDFEKIDFDECHAVHFEIKHYYNKEPTDKKYLKLVLHYHTNPYVTDSQLKLISKSKAYRERREIFCCELKELCKDSSDRLELKGTVKLQIGRVGKWSINDDISIKDFKKLIREVFEEYSPYIDKALEKSKMSSPSL